MILVRFYAAIYMQIVNWKNYVIISTNYYQFDFRHSNKYYYRDWKTFEPKYVINLIFINGYLN